MSITASVIFDWENFAQQPRPFTPMKIVPSYSIGVDGTTLVSGRELTTDTGPSDSVTINNVLSGSYNVYVFDGGPLQTHPFSINVTGSGTFYASQIFGSPVTMSNGIAYTQQQSDARYQLIIQTGSLYNITASVALNGGSGGTSLVTGSTYPITASWAVNSVTSSVLNGSTANVGNGFTFNSPNNNFSVNLEANGFTGQTGTLFVNPSKFILSTTAPNGIGFGNNVDAGDNNITDIQNLVAQNVVGLNEISCSQIVGPSGDVNITFDGAGNCIINGDDSTGGTYLNMGNNNTLFVSSLDSDENITNWELEGENFNFTNDQTPFLTINPNQASLTVTNLSCSVLTAARITSSTLNIGTAINFDGTNSSPSLVLAGNPSIGGQNLTIQSTPADGILSLSNGGNFIFDNTIQGNVIGSLTGTASLASTASFVTASNVFGSVSNATNAGTALTASYITASNVFGMVTSAYTASHLNNGGSAVISDNALVVTGSVTTTGSLIVTGGGLILPVSQSIGNSLTLKNTIPVNIFSGSTATWNMPGSATVGMFQFIKNAGSSTLTLTGAFWTNSAQFAVTVASGSAMRLIYDGNYWQVF